MNSIIQISLFCYAVCTLFLFEMHYYPPIIISVVVFVVVTLSIIDSYNLKCVGYVIGILWLCYALPFIHAIPYLWFDFDGTHPALFWGLASNSFMFDPEIVKLMLSIGAIGGAGLLNGVALSSVGIKSQPINNKILYSFHLKTFPYLGLAALAIFLASINAPDATLFKSAYTESEAVTVAMNYSSAGTLAYVLMIFLVADAVLESNPKVKSTKLALMTFVLAVVVGWFQIARGDRESFPMFISALIVIYAVKDTGFKLILIDSTMFVWGFIILAVSYLVSILRSEIAGIDSLNDFLSLLSAIIDPENMNLEILIHGTWSAVLLTPLSVAGDYLSGVLQFKYGSTYVDIFLSLPPGFIADYLDYKRPIDAYNGPAWEMRYGLGGTHLSVIPFMNFGLLGVYLICGIFGWLFHKIDVNCMTSIRSTKSLTLYGVIISATPHLVWYGEKHLINSLIYWFLIYLIYALTSTVQKTNTSDGCALSYDSGRYAPLGRV